jgi:hypothetical protein
MLLSRASVPSVSWNTFNGCWWVGMKACFMMSFFVPTLDVVSLPATADRMGPSTTPCLILLIRVLCVDRVACALTRQGGRAVLDRIK